MTQISIIQPAAPPTPPSAPPANSGSQDFSNHFEKAVSDQKEQVAHGDNDSRKGPDKAPGQEKKSSSVKNPPAGNHNDTTRNTRTTKNTAASPEDTDVTSEAVDIPTKGDNAGRQMSVQEFLAALSAELPVAASVPQSPAEDNAANPAQTETLPFLQGAAPAPLVSTPGIPPEFMSANATSSTQPQADQKPTDTLLAQLQQIIERSDEKGMVSITREDTPIVPMNGVKAIQTPWPQQSGAGPAGPIHATVTSDAVDPNVQSRVLVVDGVSTPSEKPGQQTVSMRQDTQQQYFEAKLNLKPLEKKDESMSHEQQPKSESQAQGQVQASGQNSTSSTPLSLDQTGTFSNSLASAQNRADNPATTASQAVTLPSGTIVHSDDVLQQIMDRFQLNKKPLDTQINIKLHPAELGELKIDLTVKEGSIRANVVAQSQHAQEIIERNMPKLRSVLEEQGLTVETITVSSKSDWNSDAGLFDRQLFSQGEYTPQPRKRRQDSENPFRLEQAFYPSQEPAATGVNVKI